MTEVQMKLNSEKKHSVRYDSVNPDDALSTVYIMKKFLPTPYPTEVTIKLEFKS